MVTKSDNTLPPLTKLRAEESISAVEFEILASSIEDDSMSSFSTFTTDMIKTFKSFDASLHVGKIEVNIL